MKYPELKGICKKCLGCNQLELETFTGRYKCENYVKGVKNEQVLQQKNNNRWNKIR